MTWATDISIDPSYHWTVDSDMTLSSNLDPDGILALGGSTGYSDWDGSGSGMAPPDTTKASSCCLFGSTIDSAGIHVLPKPSIT